MLNSLSITNYALIDQLNINFNRGLSTVTGETGAGKSIILGALSLLLGNRADSFVLKDKDSKCIVEGEFNVSKIPNIKTFFSENDLDFEENTIVRRQISPNGKSRAFVNDLPVNLGILKELGTFLIDIHSQHQTLNLNNSNFQLQLIDSYNQIHLEEYLEKFNSWKKSEIEYKNFLKRAQSSNQESDYLQHQYNELESAHLKENELEDLESEQQILENAEIIKSGLVYSNAVISEEEQGVYIKLKEITNQLSKIEDYNPKYKELKERIESTSIELKDISEESENLAEKIELDDSRLKTVNDRLSLIYQLMHKHKVDSFNDLIQLRNKIENELSMIDSFDFDLEQLRKKEEKLKDEAKQNAVKISKQRKGSFEKITKHITGLLQLMGMPHSKFEIQQTEIELSETGIDEISFLFSSNKQSQVQDIAKVASGGELSRLMLSLKSLLASNGNLPTIIFDEIDTGVSGEIADKMGNIMKEMSKSIQIINITHLPQIASKGDQHFKVYKNENKNSSTTQIKELNQDERINEIAQMLSGEVISEEAILNAKSLMKI